MEPDPINPVPLSLAQMLRQSEQHRRAMAVMLARQQWLLVGQTAMLMLAVLACIAKIL